jgi:quercetin dioxygenase-like cupin family protein
MAEPTVIDFDAVEWDEEAPGVRARHLDLDGVRWALVEYAPGGGRPEWCETAHVGYVLSGEIRYDFSDGREPLIARRGEGFTLPPGAAHRGRNDGAEPATLLVVDEPYLAPSS